VRERKRDESRESERFGKFFFLSRRKKTDNDAERGFEDSFSKERDFAEVQFRGVLGQRGREILWKRKERARTIL